MNRLPIIAITLVLAALVMSCTAARTNAQALEQTFTGATNSDYNLNSNWVGASGMFVPDVDLALEFAALGSNTPDPITSNVFPTATADLTTAAPDVGRLILGFGSGTTGTLNISGSGSINVKTANSGSTTLNGDVVVGGGSSGSTLNISGNGNLTADDFVVTVGNNALALTGSATLLSRGEARLLGNTSITGPNVNFSANGGLELAGTLNAVISSPTVHSKIDATGGSAIVFGGAVLNVDFSSIAAPTVGSSWEILEADAINGGFSNVQVVGATQLPNGQGVSVREVQNVGTTSLFLQVEQFLTLQVDRSTGNLTIVNQGNAAPTNNVEFDGYTITSVSQSLSTGWNSLQDQGSFGDWRESNPNAGRLSELKETGATTVIGGNSLSLGTGYNLPTQFGVKGDLEFAYTSTDGIERLGSVEYVGPANNLVLQVDPNTGEALIVNQSQFPVSIDGYTITSEDDALFTSWNSLDDQNTAGGDWRESNPTASRLSELKEDGALTLNNGDSFSLGSLYNTGLGSGDGDLVFEFLVNQEVLSGDFNLDGNVDGQDFLLWQRDLGTVPELADWEGNYGRSGGGSGGASTALIGEVQFITIPVLSAALVPEPTSLAYGLVGMLSSVAVARRKRCSATASTNS